MIAPRVSAPRPSSARRESGQVVVLMLFLSIAFFSSVALVVNVGRDVNQKIEHQTAVDAAVVSAAARLGEGMNHLAANNQAQAHAAAAIVALRALPPALEAARQSLAPWEAALRELLLAEGASGPGSTVGALEEQVLRERTALEQMARAVEALSFLDRALGIPLAERPEGGRESGALWDVLEWLTALGDAIVETTPRVAAGAAARIYQANLSPPGGEGRIVLYPAGPTIPACRGGFSDFAAPTTQALSPSVAPVRAFAQDVMTLSLFRIHYDDALERRLRHLFTGEPADAGPTPSGGTAAEEEIARLQAELIALDQQFLEVDRRLAQIARGELAWAEERLAALLALEQRTGVAAGDRAALEASIEEMTRSLEGLAEPDRETMTIAPGELPFEEAALTTLRTELAALEDEVSGLEARLRLPSPQRATLEARLREVVAAVAATEEAIASTEDRIRELEQERGVLERRRGESDADRERLRRRLEVRTDKTLEATPERLPGLAPPAFVPVPQGRHEHLHPYLLDGASWPASFTVFSLASRDLQDALGDLLLPRSVSTQVAYAAARVHAPAAADLWTPNWRAKLVRARAGHLPRAPGAVGACGEVPPEPGTAEETVRRALEAILVPFGRH